MLLNRKAQSHSATRPAIRIALWSAELYSACCCNGGAQSHSARALAQGHRPYSPIHSQKLSKTELTRFAKQPRTQQSAAFKGLPLAFRLRQSVGDRP